MFKKLQIKGFAVGLLVAILTTNIAFGATNLQSIKVSFDKVKMLFDGVEKVPAADSKAITYNGKIYVPLDFAAKSMGKNYFWDAKTKTASVGSAKAAISNGSIGKTSDGYAQLTFPAGWKDEGNSGSTILTYTNATVGSILVVRDNKTALANDATIDNYCSIIATNMSSKLETPVVTDPAKMTVNNYSALQFELQGEIQKVNIKYLITIVETKDSYYQIIAFTSQDIYDKYKKDFVNITNTFKELSK